MNGIQRIGELFTGNAMVVSPGAVGLPDNTRSVPVAIHVAASAVSRPEPLGDPMTALQERLDAAQQQTGITP